MLNGTDPLVCGAQIVHIVNIYIYIYVFVKKREAGLARALHHWQTVFILGEKSTRNEIDLHELWEYCVCALRLS